MSFIRQRPFQEKNTGPDFSKFIDQINARNKRIADKIPNWVKAGVALYGNSEDVFSNFLEEMANVVRYSGYQEDYYFDLFLQTASGLKEEKSEDIPLEELQELDFTGIFRVQFYFQCINKEVPSVISSLFQEKSAKNSEEKAVVKEIKL